MAIYLEDVLFAHRLSRHLFTKYSPIYVIYNRKPVLPADLKYGLKFEAVDLFEPFNQDMFEAARSAANVMRDEIHKAAGRNIKKAQAKQKRDFDRRHLSSSMVNVGNKALLKNNRKIDRKGAKFTYH